MNNQSPVIRNLRSLMSSSNKKQGANNQQSPINNLSSLIETCSPPPSACGPPFRFRLNSDDSHSPPSACGPPCPPCHPWIYIFFLLIAVQFLIIAVHQPRPLADLRFIRVVRVKTIVNHSSLTMTQPTD